MMVDNAVYTPTPVAIRVTVWRDEDGALHADSGVPHLVGVNPIIRSQGGEVIGTEDARVVGRGNLLRSGVERWYQVVLADGSRHMVIGEGS